MVEEKDSSFQYLVTFGVWIVGLALFTISLFYSPSLYGLGSRNWFSSPSLYGLGSWSGSTHNLFMVWVVGLVLPTISLWLG
jgi:hypothetical protein